MGFNRCCPSAPQATGSFPRIEGWDDDRNDDAGQDGSFLVAVVASRGYRAVSL